jgi:hypothetical protein
MNPLCRHILPAGRHCTQPAVRATLYRRLRLSPLGVVTPGKAKDLLFPKSTTQVNQRKVHLCSLCPLW